MNYLPGPDDRELKLQFASFLARHAKKLAMFARRTITISVVHS
ncbi:hypothetical protein [Ktedonosporobacter rubrisoli]|nr:hypothetical protein [Ktedonosporobacter rubrisoli]